MLRFLAEVKNEVDQRERVRAARGHAPKKSGVFDGGFSYG